MSQLNDASKVQRLLRMGAVADAPIIALVLIYAVGVASISALYDARLPSLSFYVSVSAKYGALAVLIVGSNFLWRLAHDRPISPIAHLRIVVKDQRLPERFKLAPTFLLVLALGALFCTAKAAIPKINPYTLDPLLADLDAAVLGRDAWRLIHPVVGYPVVSFVLAWAYQIWAIVLFAVTMIAAFCVEKPKLRFQFLMTYVLCWVVLGTILATLFSSVGPCFYQHFYKNDRFTPLMDYLTQVDSSLPLPILGVQNLLLEWHAMESPQLGSGISAMPSMHVSMALLFVLFARHFSNFWYMISIVFFIFICVESVHSGYHYASDGVVSVIVTLVLWRISGMAKASSCWSSSATPQVETGELKAGLS